MNFRARSKQPPEVNITPLIDVVFLLLIFFMVSTTFDRETRIKLQLPEASTQAEVEEPDSTLDITIDAMGRFYVNKEEVVNTRPATLRRAIEKAVGSRRDLPLIINADAKTPHQAVITVMDTASRLGLIQMTFAASKSDEQE
jgi:biopolymer transport protein ExbD